MFGGQSLSANGYIYAPLNNDENQEKQTPRPPGSLTTRLVKWLILLLALPIVASIGFFAGRRSMPLLESKEDFRLSTISRVLEYNETFAESSKASNAAWKALIPHHGGFFNHPTLAPQRSVFSVFHQLHCLNGMRQGYWALYSAMNEQIVLDEEEMPEMSSPKHFRHCVDLIRQALMCQPDLTLELKNEMMGGVAGFGTEHVCTNWGELMEFVERWEDWGRS